MKNTYKILLMASDGDHVTEGKDENWTLDEARQESANMGSRWIFYPYHFIIVDKGPVSDRQRVVDTADSIAYLIGTSIGKVRKLMQLYAKNDMILGY